MYHKLSYTELLNLNEKALLTIILPIRAIKSRNISERLTFCLQDKKLNRKKIEFLVVDDGSDKQYMLDHKNICKKNGIQYIYIESNQKEISMSRARNIGAMNAISKYIMFMDVDLYPYTGFYNDVLHEIKIQKLDQFNNNFLMFGVIYLTKNKGEELFFKTDSSHRKNTLIQKLLENDESCVEKFSTGTSVNVYNRYAYLSHGGYDEDFEKWGYEDLEFNVRMIRCSKKFPLPENFSFDYKNFKEITEYTGWKSIYRLYGDMTFQKGIILFHIWHDVDNNSDYIQGKEKNRKLFEKKIKEFSVNKKEPEALPSINKGRTLIFSKTNPFIYNRKTLPLLGVVFDENEEEFNAITLIDYISSNKIDRVLMFNPYASKLRLSLYHSLKKNNIDVIIAERGALRDSVFYDWNGFNAESNSYDAVHWDRELKESEISLVEAYIEEELQTEVSLEKQSDIIGAAKLKNKLNIPDHHKVLFIPLQRPSDTVITYFCGPIGTYDNFIKLVQEAVDTLDDHWSVVVKKHPLEDEAYHINDAIYSNDNIKDLIAMADAVLLINSGVGLLSMFWEKPVYYCGDIFYGDSRINKQVKSTHELLNFLNSDFQPDTTTIYRFLYFLLEEFYSFGKFTTKEVPWEDGGRMTLTIDIDFFKVRNIDSSKLNFYVGSKARFSKKSILFDRYRNSPQINNKQIGLKLQSRYQPRWRKIKYYVKNIPFLGKSLVSIRSKILN